VYIEAKAHEFILMMQVLVVTAMAFIVTLSAFAGFFAMAHIVHMLTPGCPDVFRTEYFALAALVALTSSTLAGFIPTMLQV
jgi:hypothetical protein